MMRYKILFVSLIFISLLSNLVCTIVFAETREVARTAIETLNEDVWITKKYDKDGKLVESIARRWFSVKPRGARLEIHGNRRFYDAEGNIIESKWYFKGQPVTMDEFKQLSKTVEFEPRAEFQKTSQDKEAKEFILQLSLAWNKHDYQKRKNIINNKLKENPGWIPAVIAKYGYYTFIEHNDEKAAEILGSIKDIIKNPDMERVNASLWRMFIGMYYHYYAQSRRGTGGKIVIFGGKILCVNKAHGTYQLFPPSDLMTAYFIASGAAINMAALRDEMILRLREKK